MEWKCSSLQIGTWLELGQLPKRSILQLNTKLPTEPFSRDQIHLRLTLPLACGLTKDHVSTREPHEERENWVRNAAVQASPFSPLYSPPSHLELNRWFSGSKADWRLWRIKGRKGKTSPVPGSRWSLVSCAGRHIVSRYARMYGCMYVCMYVCITLYK